MEDGRWYRWYNIQTEDCADGWLYSDLNVQTDGYTYGLLYSTDGGKYVQTVGCINGREYRRQVNILIKTKAEYLKSTIVL